MTLLSQSPFEWLEFDKDGALTDAGTPTRLSADLAGAGVTNLVILSHGWKTDQAGANDLYTPLWDNVTKALVAAGDPKPSGIVVGGVLWPSLLYRTDFDEAAAEKASGGTLSATAPLDGDGDLADDQLQGLLNGYSALVGATAGAAVTTAAQAIKGGWDDTSAKALLDALKASVGIGQVTFDPELKALAEGYDSAPADILGMLGVPPTISVTPKVGGALGLGDIVSNIIQGPKAAIGRLLNQLTYFEMKQRAGTVGGRLGAELLSNLRPPHSIRLHLIGHSFGARLVTAAAASFSPSPNLKLASLTLLQGAYSQNGMSASFADGQSGAYAKVIGDKLVAGPITMTHTHNDSACTIAYPLASRLSRDISQSLGDASDLFGAMGANGAQNLDENAYANDQTMVKGAPTYGLKAGKVNRMLADNCVSEHMDVTNADVGALVASVLRT